MIYLKTKEEIAIIREGGKILAKILKRLSEEVHPGVETAYLENLALEMMKEAGARPAFKNYDMGGGLVFPSALCTSINSEVVHGVAIPSRVLKNGDIIDIDIGMEYPFNNSKPGEITNANSLGGGFYTDMSKTIAVGKISREAAKLIKVTKLCLEAGISQAKPGKTLNDIGRAVQRLAKIEHYGVVRDYVGHGVGYYAHEDPNVPNYELPGNDGEGDIVLKPGMVLAIEPMINLGTWKVKIAKNGYTVLTADNSLSAHFEHTVAITETGCEILTLL